MFQAVCTSVHSFKTPPSADGSARLGRSASSGAAKPEWQPTKVTDFRESGRRTAGADGGLVREGLHVADLDTVTAGKAGELWIATGEGKGLERSTINQRRRHLNSTSAFIGNILLSKVDPRASEDKLPAKTISVRQRADEFGLIGRPKSIAGERSLPSSSMPSRNGSLPAQRGARAGVPRRLRQRREPREHRQPKLRSCLGGCWCCRRHWQAGPRRQSSPDGEVHRPSRLAALLRLIAHQSAAEVTRSRLRQTPTGTCSR